MPDNTEDALKKIREEIDVIDRQLLSLFNERAKCAEQVAKIKLANDGDAAVFYRPEREAQVLEKVMSENPGPLNKKTVGLIFRELMSACLALEQPLKVAYLGPEGTFTQSAALKHFGHGIEAKGLAAIDEVFREVESGSVNYGVVPVENSTEGMVNHTLDNLIDSNLKICGEVELRIHHHFLLSDSGDATALNKIYSHQQSLAQCRKWLDANYPNVERISVSSNAEAARLASKEAGSAAIAGEIAAEIYGLNIASRQIEDNPNNCTRFLVIGHDEIPASGKDKSSFVVSTRNKPGALYELLEPFYKNEISLTRIETRPARDGSWAYVFFIDFEGHYQEEPAKSVLIALENEVVELRRLGAYPKAVL
jgi:chorismate mutase/prephenate dehydratase